MAAQIKWFEKSKCDLENVDCDIVITDAVAYNNGQEFANRIRDRKNYTAWMTTDSTDAANTQIDVSLGDPRAITNIILLGHNFKSYTIQYKNGIGSYQNFSTTINPTTNTLEHTYYSFTEVNATDIRIIILGCMVINDDKILKQLIITKSIGAFTGWPQITSPKIDTQRKSVKMLSGKLRIIEGLESFSCSLDVKAWRIQDDIDILETIYFKREGVLMWIQANDANQFFLDLKGYRKDDIYLVRPTDNWEPLLLSGVYVNPIKVSMALAEVIS